MLHVYYTMHTTPHIYVHTHTYTTHTHRYTTQHTHKTIVIHNTTMFSRVVDTIVILQSLHHVISIEDGNLR